MKYINLFFSTSTPWDPNNVPIAGGQLGFARMKSGTIHEHGVVVDGTEIQFGTLERTFHCQITRGSWSDISASQIVAGIAIYNAK